MMAVLLAACAARAPARSPTWGPVDGRDLPPSEIERVAIGDSAPDFTLLDSESHPLTLSSLRGRYVVLVFYRGYW